MAQTANTLTSLGQLGASPSVARRFALHAEAGVRLLVSRALFCCARALDLPCTAAATAAVLSSRLFCGIFFLLVVFSFLSCRLSLTFYSGDCLVFSVL